jgi:hypothetical protein
MLRAAGATRALSFDTTVNVSGGAASSGKRRCLTGAHPYGRRQDKAVA